MIYVIFAAGFVLGIVAKYVWSIFFNHGTMKVDLSIRQFTLSLDTDISKIPKKKVVVFKVKDTSQD